MVKVIHFFYSFGMGGAEMQAYRLCECSNGEHKILVLSNFDLQFFVNHGFSESHFIIFPSSSYWDSLIYHLKYIVKNRASVTFVSWLYKTDILIGICRIFLNFNWYLSIRSHTTKKGVRAYLGKKVLAKLSKKSSGIIYNSNISLEYHEKLNFSNKNSCVIYNGYLTKKINRSKTIEKNSIVFLGRLHEDKGIDLFIDFLIINTNRLLLYKYTVYIAGIKASMLFEKYPVLSRLLFVEIVGTIDPYSFLCDKEYLILPSRRESMPNVVIESLLMGLKVLASDVGDLRRIFPDCITFINPMSSEDIWLKLRNHSNSVCNIDIEDWDISNSLNRFNKFLCVEY